uniref:GTP-binding protein REM 1 n=1 Tax=Sipha flava TaxID=143950 RepID=A0A2S2R9I7_9HEMI
MKRHKSHKYSSLITMDLCTVFRRLSSAAYGRSTPNWNNKERKGSAVLLDALIINKSQSAAVVMSDTGQVATIVVQQPSLSANSPDQGHEGCQTAPVELPIDFNRWPDFANSLSSQQYHDFQMKYGSPHHSRSQSVRTPGSKSTVQLQLGPNGIPKNRSNQLTLPQQRSRVASMPNTGVEEEYYRIRQFSITGKGIINRGDSLKSRRSKSNNSVASSTSSTEHLTTSNYTVIGVGGIVGSGGGGGGGGSYPGSARTSAGTSLASSRESSCASCPGITQPFRIAMLGATGVGKTSLVCQFMTSESLHIYDASIDEDGEKSVSVLLDAEESELIFLDKSSAPADCNDVFEESPHAYCIIYSRNDWDSFKQAEEWLQALWKADVVRNKAVILVGNKNDIVRPNIVPSGVGKQMATRYDCKFIETSVIINYNVDELLVGILTQIRLKLDQPPEHGVSRSSSMRKRSKSPLANCGPTFKKYRGSRTSTSLRVKGLLSKVWARDSKSKSCENLHVL